MLQAGKLNQRIALQASTPTTSATGQRIDSWATVATVWADVQQIGGREQLRAGRELAQGEYSIRIRYRSAVKAGMRVLLADGTTLTIAVPQVDRRAGWITLTAIQEPNQ